MGGACGLLFERQVGDGGCRWWMAAFDPKRSPLQLMGIVRVNAGGFGSI